MNNFRSYVCVLCHVDYLFVFLLFFLFLFLFGFFFFGDNLTNKARGTTRRMRNIAFQAHAFFAGVLALLFADFSIFCWAALLFENENKINCHCSVADDKHMAKNAITMRDQRNWFSVG